MEYWFCTFESDSVNGCRFGTDQQLEADAHERNTGHVMQSELEEDDDDDQRPNAWFDDGR